MTEQYHTLREALLQKLKTLVADDVSFEQYHQFVTNEEEHKRIQFALFNYVHEIGLHNHIITENLSLFQAFYGPDIDIQVKPYMRIARPNCPQDNIGFHWDTFYGNSAFETSCVLPITENTADGVLQLAPGSHRWETPEYTQQQHQEVTKGSEQNQMGFLYAPKQIQGLDRSKVTPVLVKPTQVLLFSLGVLHGQEINRDPICRWSIDFRLKNAFAPVSKNLKAGYYQPLSRSVVSHVSSQYYQNKIDEKTLLTQDF